MQPNKLGVAEWQNPGQLKGQAVWVTEPIVTETKDSVSDNQEGNLEYKLKDEKTQYSKFCDHYYL